MKNEFSFFNLYSKKDCSLENVKKIYNKIVKENHPDYFSENLSIDERKQKTEYYYKIQENYKKIKEEYENSFEHNEYVKGIDFEVGIPKKGNYNENLFFFNYNHPVIQEFIDE